jgi:hypothetical protein
LDHFALLEDDRESWSVAHPLPEVLLLVVCGTIGACDDFDEIVEWGEDNLPFLRRFLPYRHGIPGSRWLRILLNRIDTALFSQMFQCIWSRPSPPARSWFSRRKRSQRVVASRRRSRSCWSG